MHTKLDNFEMMNNKGFDSDGFANDVNQICTIDQSLDFQNNMVFKSKRVDHLKEQYKFRMAPRMTEMASAKSQLMKDLPNLDSVRKSLSILSKDGREKVREDVMKTVMALNELEVIEDIIQDSK